MPSQCPPHPNPRAEAGDRGAPDDEAGPHPPWPAAGLDGAVVVTYRFEIGNDPEAVPRVVARLHELARAFGLWDEGTALRVDLALNEALLNAIYHGNLEVSSDLRQDGDDPFYALVAERRATPPYRDRRVHVRARFGPGAAAFTILDEGPGFDPSRLPDPDDPAGLERVGGRGLLLIRTYFDEVTFNEAGNRIDLVKRRAARIG